MLAFDDDIVRPFTPVRVTGNRIGILGRQLILGPSGLPAQIESYYTPEVTRIQETARLLLAAPMQLIAEDAAGRRLTWSPGTITFTKQERWDRSVDGRQHGGPAQNGTERGAWNLTASFNSGSRSTLSRAVEVRDVRLEMPLAKEAVRYMMGLGLKGGFRPPSYDWPWDVKKNQDGAWLGDCRCRTAVQPEGGKLLASSKYQFLPVQAAEHASFLV